MIQEPHTVLAHAVASPVQEMTRDVANTLNAPTGQDEIPLRVYFGHHKCASRWINDILREVCCHIGIMFQIVHRPVDFEDIGPLGTFVDRQGIDFLAYTNADRDYIGMLPAYRGFHVVRDPRDILVSAYFSHLHSHGTENWPELEAHRQALQTLSQEDGLLSEMEFNRWVFEDMQQWDYQQEHILELKMEELTVNPVQGFLHILRFLGLLEEEKDGVAKALHSMLMETNRLSFRGRRYMPASMRIFPIPRRRLQGVSVEKLEAVVEKMNFAKQAGGRRKGQEDVKSHYRKGVSGDWKNYFNEKHKRVFKSMYDDLLLKLGYETDNDW